jgi:MGT family glycosyltransferase
VSNSLNPALPADLDSELLRTVAWLAPERAELFARHGLAPQFRGCDVLSPHLTIAFTTPALVGDVPGVELVGPSLPRGARGDEADFPWGWLDPSQPLVYASFGSQVYHQPALFRRILDAVAGRRVQLVASASDLATSRWPGIPANVLLRPYVPQLQLLPRVSAVITHGGANSVMEAIAWRVPLLVMPLCNDQFHQAHFVERAGIGRTLDAERAIASDIGHALDALVTAGKERTNMIAVGATYQRDGAAEVARLIIRLAARSHPAPGS